ncbi:unnamed protein product, partial [Polarella glacialis]
PEKTTAALKERVAMLEKLLERQAGSPLQLALGGGSPPKRQAKAAKTAAERAKGNNDNNSKNNNNNNNNDNKEDDSCSTATEDEDAPPATPAASHTRKVVETGAQPSVPSAATTESAAAPSTPAPPESSSSKGKGKGKSSPPPPPPSNSPGGKAKGKGSPPPPPPAASPEPKGKGKGPGKGPGKAKGPGKMDASAASGSVLAPRKADVKPNVPMKRLFWNSFALKPEQLEKLGHSTVWTAIEEDGIDGFDVEELETLFAEAQPGRALPRAGDGSSGPGSGKAQQRARVFEETRRRQVCVMLARLPPADTTVDAVATMDDARLDKDQVELLLANAPPPEELTALRSAAAELTKATPDVPVHWEDAEAFVLKLGEVPSFALRLQVWSFENSFEERYHFFHAAATEVKEACRALRNSARTQRLLGLALSVGNYMNAGTSRGRADGFSVEALAQMRTVKAMASGPSSTLVDFLVRQLERSSPGDLASIFAESGEATVVHKAMRHKPADLSQELSSYRTQAQGLARRAADAADEALGVRSERVALRVEELVSLERVFEEADQDYASLCAWFQEGGTKKPRPADEFFTLWDGFFQAIRVALEGLYGGRTSRRRKANRSKPLRPLEPYKRSLNLDEPMQDDADDK